MVPECRPGVSSKLIVSPCVPMTSGLTSGERLAWYSPQFSFSSQNRYPKASGKRKMIGATTTQVSG